MCSVSTSAPQGLNCETCGKSLTRSKRGPQPRFCSDACRPRHWVMRFVCGKCGGPSSRPAVVGVCRKCHVPHNAGKSRYGSTTRGGKNACPTCGAQKCAVSALCAACRQQSQKPKPFICMGCGKESDRPSWGVRDPRMYCGRGCAFATKTTRARAMVEAAKLAKADRKSKRKAEKAAQLALRTCRKCGTSIGHLPEASRNCKECRNALRLAAHTMTKQCGRCGKSHKTSKHKPAPHCQACKKQIRRRQERHSSRCLRRGLPFDPNVTITSLYALCDGKCFWCGVKCLVRYSHGKHKHKSPTCDHVVPLSHEGNKMHGHTFFNCVLSCAQCNTNKRDTMDDGALLSECPVEYMAESCGPALQWKRKELFMDSWVTQPKTPLFEHFARRKHNARRTITQQNNAFST